MAERSIRRKQVGSKRGAVSDTLVRATRGKQALSKGWYLEEARRMAQPPRVAGFRLFVREKMRKSIVEI